MGPTVDRSSTVAPEQPSPRPRPICGLRAARTLRGQRYALFDDSALPDATRIVECDGYGMVHAASTATAADYRRHYTRHSKYDTAVDASGSGETVADAARLDGTLQFLAARVAPAASIVYVDAGRGGPLFAFGRHGYERVTGIDPAPGCVAAMRARGLHAEVGTLEKDAWPTAIHDGVDDAALEALAGARTAIVVWGAGSHAQRLLAQSALGRCAIDCVIDADPGKQGRSLAGHAVVSPEAGLERVRTLDATVVVAIAIGGAEVVERVRRALQTATVLRP